jgi:4a-hydroxytetrahydrobiopterin dehydratase
MAVSPLRRQQISEVVDPLGWRLVLGVAVTHVAVPSLTAAADAASIVVSAAGADGDGHLSVDLHADRIVLRLHTTTVGSVTEHDLGLAHRVTEALTARGLRAAPGEGVVVPQTIEIAIDALDIPLIRPFWQAVTGYVDEPGPPDLPDGALLDPLRRGPAIWFQQMDAPRPAQSHPPRRRRCTRTGHAPHRRGAGRRGDAALRRCRACVLGTRRSRGQRGVRLHVAGSRLVKVVLRDHPHVRTVPAHPAR